MEQNLTRYGELIEMAMKAKEKAYAPYSKFKVGAALITESGHVYSGGNIENVSFGASNCAERTAIFKAVSDGEKILRAIAICSDSEEYIYPCGICRQVLVEFAAPDLQVICCKKNGEYRVIPLENLLPEAFKSF